VEPDRLDALFAPLTTLDGVGEARAALIARAAGGSRVVDLLFHLPESWCSSGRFPEAASRPGRAC
jgi:ATP-dependent DNA helicase RecG